MISGVTYVASILSKPIIINHYRCTYDVILFHLENKLFYQNQQFHIDILFSFYLSWFFLIFFSCEKPW